MTRLEFEEIESFYDLIALCDEAGSNICCNIYDRDGMEREVLLHVKDAILNGGIFDLDTLISEVSRYNDLPYADYYIRDDWGDWYEVNDGDEDFEEHKSRLRDFMEVNNLFDDEEEESENENDTEFGVADFSIQELIQVSVETVGG